MLFRGHSLGLGVELLPLRHEHELASLGVALQSLFVELPAATLRTPHQLVLVLDLVLLGDLLLGKLGYRDLLNRLLRRLLLYLFDLLWLHLLFLLDLLLFDHFLLRLFFPLYQYPLVSRRLRRLSQFEQSGQLLLLLLCVVVLVGEEQLETRLRGLGNSILEPKTAVYARGEPVRLLRLVPFGLFCRVNSVVLLLEHIGFFCME